MTAVDGPTLDTLGPVAPDVEHLEACARLPTATLGHVSGPKSQDGAGQLPAPVGLVVHQVELHGAVVHARGAYGLRVGEAAQVLGVGLGGDCALHGSPALQQEVQVGLGAVADHSLGQGRRLAHQVPVEPCERQGRVHVLEGGLRGDDVQRRECPDAFGVVERHAVPNPCAPVVADDVVRVEAERIHHLDLVLGRRALAVDLEPAVGWRLAAVAVAA